MLGCVLCNLSVNAQSKAFDLPTQSTDRINTFLQDKSFFKSAKSGSFYYLILQLEALPTAAHTRILKEQNISLQSYLGNNRYVARLPKGISANELKRAGIIDLQLIAPEQKTSSAIKNKNYSDWERYAADRIRVAVVFYEGVAPRKIEATLAQLQFEATQKSIDQATIWIGHLPEKEITNLAQQPIVAFVDLQQEPDQSLNYENRCIQNISAVSSNVIGGKNLNGEGVCIGVGDGGELGNHLDFSNRVSFSVDGKYEAFGDHGDHVAGIIGGAGLINPRHQGIAPKASLLIEKTSRVTTYLDDYYNDYGMVITNNSYGTSYDCADNGAYNYTSHALDKQLLKYPEVLHIFAAGNSGGGTCAPYPAGYRTVLKYYQSAKNVLTVGVVDEDRVVWSGSSRGPVLDGRLKPEIVGVGKYVSSTGDNFNYMKKTGSSMAAPSVAGTIGLMYEQYRKSNGGANPKAALMKAIACNSADDLGNVGPDYIYGYGLVNGRRAVETIEAGQFFSDSIATGSSNTDMITVPAGTKQLKVMLYWHDKEADADPTKALVNDLDLSLKNPADLTFLPWILNTNAANVADLAVRGVDTLNNIEQITIDNPVAGNYFLKVEGTAVPFGPQSYHLVYEFVTDEIVVAHPFGGEILLPNAKEKIIWDTDPTNTHMFTAEYSLDEGATWNLITDTIPATARMIDWKVPIVYSDKALVRVSKNGTNVSDESNAACTIIITPTNLTATARCEGYIQLEWYDNVQTETFEVLHFNGTAFVALGTTTETSFVVDNNLTMGERQWFALRGISPTGAYSERCIAVEATPAEGGVCPWEDDITLKTVELAKRGRAYTSSALGTQEQVVAEVMNKGVNTINLFELNVLVNGTALNQQNVSYPLASGDSLQVNLSQGLDLSAAGVYEISAWAKANGDTHLNNDSIVGQLEATQLENPRLVLPQWCGVSDGEEETFTENQMGFTNLPAWDFETNGMSQLSVNASTASLTLQPTSATTASSSNILLTVNLTDYLVDEDNVKIEFDYQFTPINPAGSGTSVHKVWTRGNDQAAWIELSNLSMVSEMTTVTISNISLAMKNAGQAFSSSTQFRFSQDGFAGLILSGINIETESSLPVELAYFKAHKMDENAWLIWKTISEFENAFFEVQVAVGEEALQERNFEVIGQVPGVGTISSEKIYEYWDRTANKSGIRYYRLKQVDLDGSFTYTDTKAVDFGEAKQQSGDQVVYPNPFFNELRLKYASSSAQTIQLILCDMQGKQIQQTVVSVEAGDNDLKIAVTEAIPSGMYHLKLMSSDAIPKSFTIVKQQF